ncbi:hypothetical protein [Chryseobacterium lathyri]|uniref:hypothetical protein n=1 Tax=Chryseobacterium lathyri TaxID=395933 RepID=UPI0027820F58|nr:hypothetical protein [Chryseobacterium lathyri]MDQ0065118.1 hypothetical protein [Chryseobacterium lathyri]
MKTQLFKFYTQYNQFYVADKTATGNTGSLNFWDEKAFNARLALEHDIIGISTQSYGNIKGEIEVLEKPSVNVDLQKYDHVVEGGIQIPSGELQILNSPDNNVELTVNVNPGNYRVRVYSSNLDSVEEDDEPHDTDADYYRIELWKSDNNERKVLKQYNRN